MFLGGFVVVRNVMGYNLLRFISKLCLKIVERPSCDPGGHVSNYIIWLRVHINYITFVRSRQMVIQRLHNASSFRLQTVSLIEN